MIFNYIIERRQRGDAPPKTCAKLSAIMTISKSASSQRTVATVAHNDERCDEDHEERHDERRDETAS